MRPPIILPHWIRTPYEEEVRRTGRAILHDLPYIAIDEHGTHIVPLSDCPLVQESFYPYLLQMGVKRLIRIANYYAHVETTQLLNIVRHLCSPQYNPHAPHTTHRY